MADAVNVDTLSIKIETTSNGAAESIDKLTSSLTRLGQAVSSTGLSQLSNNLSTIAKSAKSISTGNLATLANSIKRISESSSGMQKLTSAIKELPNVSKALKNVDFDELTDGVNSLTTALQPLVTQMNSLNSSAQALPNTLNAIANAYKQANKRTTEYSTSSSSLSFTLVKLYSTMVSVAGIARTVINTIGSLISASSSYTENMNMFSVSLGQYAQSALDYAEEVSAILGIDVSEWIRQQGIFNTIIEGFGVASDSAAVMSQQLTQLTYDLASFYDLEYDEAFTKLESAISGELEPLRRLGYDLSVARLQQEAYNLGIEESVSNMTQAEKAQLRYYAIMNQVTVAQGDMARTLSAPANQLRILTTQLTQCARAIGNIFIPALNAILPVVIAVINVLSALANIIAGLFGFEFSGVDWEAASADTGSYSSAVDDVADSYGNAADAAEEFKKQTMGIDELNILQSPDTSSSGSSGSGGTGGSGGGGLDIPIDTYDFLGDAVTQRFQEIADKIKEWLGITDEIDTWSELFDTRLGHILSLVGLIGAGFALWKIGSDVMKFIQLLSTGQLSYQIGIGFTIVGAAMLIDGFLHSLSDGLQSIDLIEMLGGTALLVTGAIMLGSQLGSGLATGIIAGAAAGIIAGGVILVASLWDICQNGLNEVNSKALVLSTTLIGASIGLLIAGPLGAGIGALAGFVVGKIAEMFFESEENVQAFADFCSDAWNTIKDVCSVVWNVITGIITAAIVVVGAVFSTIVDIVETSINTIKTTFQILVLFFKTAWYAISAVASEAWDIIVGVWEVVSGWFNENVIEPVKTVFSGAWDSITGWASDAWEDIKEVFSPVTDWFSDKFSAAWSKVTQVFSPLGNVFTTITDGISSIFKELVNGIIKGFNSVISYPFRQINRTISKLKNFSVLGMTPFSGLEYLSIPQIPYLAKGGVVSSGQLFMARENGPELVARAGRKSAVMNNDQIVASVSSGVKAANDEQSIYLQQMVALLSQQANAGQDITVIAEIDGEVVYKDVVRRNNRKVAQTGQSDLAF